MASRSKSRQKVEESSKSPKNLKGLKSCKGHRFKGTFTKAPVLRQRRTRACVRTLTVFRALFAGPRSYLDTTLASIINKAKLIELLMYCPHQSAQRTCSLHYFSSEMHFKYSGIRTTQKLAMNVLPPLKFCRCAPEEGVLVQNKLDGWEAVKGVVHHQGLFYVPEIIRIKLISHFGIENLTTCCQEIL